MIIISLRYTNGGALVFSSLSFAICLGSLCIFHSPLGAEGLQLAVQRGLHVLLGIEAHGRVELLVHQFPLYGGHFVSLSGTASSCCCIKFVLFLFLLFSLTLAFTSFLVDFCLPGSSLLCYSLLSRVCLQKFFQKILLIKNIWKQIFNNTCYPLMAQKLLLLLLLFLLLLENSIMEILSTFPYFNWT